MIVLTVIILFRRKEMDFLSGLNDRSKDVVYNFLLDFDPIINNKPNPEDHDTKLFPIAKKSKIVRPEQMMAGATSSPADSNGSLKPSASEESLGMSTTSEKDESANNKSESGSDQKEAADNDALKSSGDLNDLREPSRDESK